MKLNKIMKIVVAMLLMALVAVVASQAVMAGIDPATASLSNTFKATDTSGASSAAANIIGMIINISIKVKIPIAPKSEELS